MSPWHNPASFEPEPEEPPMPTWGKWFWSLFIGLMLTGLYLGARAL